MPGVVGELLAGVIIGPYLLGSRIHVPLEGHMIPLFPRPAHGEWPMGDVLWAFAQFASIILLFLTGLHTDLKQFLKYVGPAALVAIVGKLVGCGAAALPMGFNRRGAYRIGLGMMPRGEVALIVAGIGLSRHLIGEVVFGVSILMTLITTILAPVLLVPAFARGGSGRMRPEEAARGLPSVSALPGLEVQIPDSLSEMFVHRLLQLAEQTGWHASYDRADENIYLLRSRGDAAQVAMTDNTLRIVASDSRQPEFSEMLELVKRTMADDVTAVTITTAPRADQATAATAVG